MPTKRGLANPHRRHPGGESLKTSIGLWRAGRFSMWYDEQGQVGRRARIGTPTSRTAIAMSLTSKGALALALALSSPQAGGESPPCFRAEAPRHLQHDTQAPWNPPHPLRSSLDTAGCEPTRTRLPFSPLKAAGCVAGGAAVGGLFAFPSFMLGGAMGGSGNDWGEALLGATVGASVGYTIGNSLGVYWIGNIGDARGSYLATLLGSTVGMLAGLGLVFGRDPHAFSSGEEFLILTVPPPLIATTAFWLTVKHEMPISPPHSSVDLEPSRLEPDARHLDPLEDAGLESAPCWRIGLVKVTY